MLAEQIATLETNYADAQAKITAQDSSIETLTVSVAALTKDKLQLEAGLADSQKRVADLEAHNDETMAAVEKLASSALDMLRVAQRPPGTPAAIIPFAPKPKIDLAAALQIPDTAAAAAVQADSLKAVADAVNIDPPGQAAVAEIMANDSSDEQPQPEIVAPPAQPAQPIPTNDTPAASDDAMNRIHSTALPDNVMTGGPLPVFLQRDTVLQREGVNVLG